jgi:hypothetical protein
MDPGASEEGCSGWGIRSSSGGRCGVSASSIGSPWGTTWSSTAGVVEEEVSAEPLGHLLVLLTVEAEEV